MGRTKKIPGTNKIITHQYLSDFFPGTFPDDGEIEDARHVIFGCDSTKCIFDKTTSDKNCAECRIKAMETINKAIEIGKAYHMMELLSKTDVIECFLTVYRDKTNYKNWIYKIACENCSYRELHRLEPNFKELTCEIEGCCLSDEDIVRTFVNTVFRKIYF